MLLWGVWVVALPLPGCRTLTPFASSHSSTHPSNQLKSAPLLDSTSFPHSHSRHAGPAWCLPVGGKVEGVSKGSGGTGLVRRGGGVGVGWGESNSKPAIEYPSPPPKFHLPTPTNPTQPKPTPTPTARAMKKKGPPTHMHRGKGQPKKKKKPGALVVVPPPSSSIPQPPPLPSSASLLPIGLRLRKQQQAARKQQHGKGAEKKVSGWMCVCVWVEWMEGGGGPPP